MIIFRSCYCHPLDCLERAKQTHLQGFTEQLYKFMGICLYALLVADLLGQNTSKAIDHYRLYSYALYIDAFM